MTTFVQLHLLTAYPPANLNRDDTGRPKTARFGNVDRLRVSSQALKRAWREAWRYQDGFDPLIKESLGDRTQRLGIEFQSQLASHGLDEEQSKSIARVLASIFGAIETESGKDLFIRQLAFVSPSERSSVSDLIQKISIDADYRSRFLKASDEVTLESGDDEESKSSKKPKRSKETSALIKELKGQIFRTVDGAVDIGMFGRMLADDPDFNREAAVQVAHAITTHRSVVEDDYYTAMDDLKEEAGAGFVGEAGFGAGTFYLYLCIDFDLLVKNLGGDEDLAKRSLEALIRAAATVGPKGKQASFASRARASYGLVEVSDAAPHTLAAAFLKPVSSEDVLGGSITAFEATRAGFLAAYDLPSSPRDDDPDGWQGNKEPWPVYNVLTGEGSLARLIDYVKTEVDTIKNDQATRQP